MKKYYIYSLSSVIAVFVCLAYINQTIYFNYNQRIFFVIIAGFISYMIISYGYIFRKL